MKVKVPHLFWRDPTQPDIINGINESDKILMTYSNRLDLEKELIKGNNIHYVRWIINPSNYTIELLNQYRHTERGWCHPFLWQNELEEWLLRKICKSNWRYYKLLFNPSIKIKKDYFKLMRNKDYIKKQKINDWEYNFFKPSWDYKNRYKKPRNIKKTKENKKEILNAKTKY